MLLEVAMEGNSPVEGSEVLQVVIEDPVVSYTVLIVEEYSAVIGDVVRKELSGELVTEEVVNIEVVIGDVVRGDVVRGDVVTIDEFPIRDKIDVVANDPVVVALEVVDTPLVTSPDVIGVGHILKLP